MQHDTRTVIEDLPFEGESLFSTTCKTWTRASKPHVSGHLLFQASSSMVLVLVLVSLPLFQNISRPAVALQVTADWETTLWRPSKILLHLITAVFQTSADYVSPRHDPCPRPASPILILVEENNIRKVGPLRHKGGYAIKFMQIPSKSVFLITSPSKELWKKIQKLLCKNTIEQVPAGIEGREFYSCYFTVSKRVGGLQPILDLRGLNKFISYR